MTTPRQSDFTSPYTLSLHLLPNPYISLLHTSNAPRSPHTHIFNKYPDPDMFMTSQTRPSSFSEYLMSSLNETTCLNVGSQTHRPWICPSTTRWSGYIHSRQLRLWRACLRAVGPSHSRVHNGPRSRPQCATGSLCKRQYSTAPRRIDEYGVLEGADSGEVGSGRKDLGGLDEREFIEEVKCETG